MAFWRSLVTVVAVTLAGVLPASAAATSEVLPPAAAAGDWRTRGSVRTYSPTKLYEYIDGNADLFLSYEFADLAVGDYEPSKGEGWISVDVYNMATPLQAFGIFGAERPPDVLLTALGAQGYESDGLIAFWKGQYYVKVSLVEGEDTAAARKLAQAAAGRIGAPAAMPVELDRLPAKDRLPGSERYFRRGALGHAFLGNMVSSQYELGPGTASLCVADLRVSETSTASYDRLREYYQRTGTRFVDLPTLGKQAFAAQDEFYGEVVAVAVDQFVIIATSETAPRRQLIGFVTEGIAAARAASASEPAPTGMPVQACPLSGPCPSAQQTSP
ncbi:MAG: DUF6599 family protein [Armatimonadota bacterium]